jgi:hypothetical protein
MMRLLAQATADTLTMVALAAGLGTLFGLPLGIFLATSRRGELLAAPWLNGVLGFVVNATRSTPFIILVVAIIPFTRLIAGTSIGTMAATVPLTIAATPFIARLVEAAIREVDHGLVEAAREAVRAEVEKARKAAPKIVGPVAIVPIDSACQIHPLIAQTWSGRLKAPIVMAANFGYRPGWVHFAARTGQDADIPAFLAGVRPPGADEQYGKGHRLASGGALRVADWNIFVRTLGFGPELKTA